MAHRQYDYDLIKRLLKEDPQRAHDTIGLAEAYNARKGKEEITPKTMRRIVYGNYQKWMGTPVPLLPAGRRPRYDVDYIWSLRDENPDVPVVKLAEIYNRNRDNKIPASTMAQILRRPRG